MIGKRLQMLPPGAIIESRRPIPGLPGFEELVVRNWETDPEDGTVRDAIFLARAPLELLVVGGKHNPCCWLKFTHMDNWKTRDKVTNTTRQIVLNNLMQHLHQWGVDADVGVQRES